MLNVPNHQAVVDIFNVDHCGTCWKLPQLWADPEPPWRFGQPAISSWWGSWGSWQTNFRIIGSLDWLNGNLTPKTMETPPFRTGFSCQCSFHPILAHLQLHQNLVAKTSWLLSWATSFEAQVDQLLWTFTQSRSDPSDPKCSPCLGRPKTPCDLGNGRSFCGPGCSYNAFISSHQVLFKVLAEIWR